MPMNFQLSEIIPYIKDIAIFIDIILVYFLIYRLLIWIINTHTQNLMKGLLWIFIIYLFSHFLGLTTLNWILEKFATVLLLLFIIIFQPELRRFLERLGSSGNLFTPLLGETKSTSLIKQLLKAIDQLSKEKIGALIVIEISANLSEYIESGVPISGTISSDLLINLFWPNSPTHDGAVILRENKIAAAGCLLPLTETPLTDRRLGTRHRAAIGLSELTDAVIIIISEETGIISLAEKGDLTRYLTKENLESRLFNLYQEDNIANKSNIKNVIKSFFFKKYK
jgi:diadenylate cyclase